MTELSVEEMRLRVGVAQDAMRKQQAEGLLQPATPPAASQYPPQADWSAEVAQNTSRQRRERGGAQ